MEPARGVQEHHVVSVASGVLYGGFGNVHRVDLAHLEHGNVQLPAHHLQLLDGGGAVHIAGAQQGTLALLLHQARQLRAVGGLACALEAHQHHHRGRSGGDGQLGLAAPHEGGQLLVDDLHDHLGGGEGFHHVLAHGPLGDGGDEALHHFEVHVRLQKGHLDLLHGLLHVRLGEAALAPQAFEGGGQLFG